jgi:rSAM/selenodomain-associated transferase 1
MTAVCVMAKAPVPGRVKTRLVPTLSDEQAAELAAAFLIDTWRIAAALPGARPLLARAGAADRFPAALAGVDAVDQRGADLGARIESALVAALERGSPALVIGADLPGLPLAHLEAARAALAGADCVLGPSDDGGFYLIGANRWSPGALADLPWSRPETREATAARLESLGLVVATAPPFDDVDDPADLERLRVALRAGPDRAPATAALLARLP